MPRCFGYLLLILASSLVSVHAWAVGIAVIKDGEAGRAAMFEQVFINELMALTGDEFDITLYPETGNWTRVSIEAAFQRAYANPKVDMVLAVGPAGSQLGLLQKTFSKPTFLPLVFDGELAAAPNQGNTSGVTNLNYLTDGAAFSDELATMRSLLDFRKIAVVADRVLGEAIASQPGMLQQISAGQQLEIVIVDYDGRNHDLVERIPADVDLVLTGQLLRLPEPELAAFIQGLIERKLPSVSMVGKTNVSKGLLATLTVDAAASQIARRNALNMQAVLLGEKPRKQPVSYESKRRFIINMATARAIGLALPFDVSSEAELLNVDVRGGPTYTLEQVARKALAANLQLRAAERAVAAGSQTVGQARAGLLPQLQSQVTYSQRKQSRQVDQGLLSERTTDGALSLSQVLYSDNAWNNLRVQQDLQKSREADYAQTQLDIIQAATVAYLNVLRAQTGLRVQQENLRVSRINLDLAKNRQTVGATSAADVYRWQSQLASGQQSVLAAQASLEQSRDTLNRLLNKPITAPFNTYPETVKNPALLLTSPELIDFVQNETAFNAMADFIVSQGLKESPRLISLREQIAAAEKTFRKERRAHWLPEFNLTGQWQHNIDNNLIGSAPQPEDSDWVVSVNATLPLFTSGALTATERQARYSLQQLKYQYLDGKLLQEQEIRRNIHAIRASFPSIELARAAAEASQKNYDLVADGYAQGTVKVVDLLDAQNSLLSANEQAANAAYDFLIDLMNLQRESGHFDFFLTEAQTREHLAEMKAYVDRALKK